MSYTITRERFNEVLAMPCECMGEMQCEGCMILTQWGIDKVKIVDGDE